MTSEHLRTKAKEMLDSSLHMPASVKPTQIRSIFDEPIHLPEEIKEKVREIVNGEKPKAHIEQYNCE